MIFRLFIIVFLFLTFSPSSIASPQYGVNDTLFIYLKGGGCDIYPMALVQVENVSGGGVKVSWNTSSLIYNKNEIERVNNIAPDNLPKLTTFKLNKRNNNQLMSDIDAQISGNHVNIRVGGIGKWLTPTFTLSDSKSCAYVGGKLQRSDFDRHHFDNDVKYIVAFSNMRVLKYYQTQSGSISLRFEPYGMEYIVHVDWLTDSAENFPSVRINTKNGQMIGSKEYYIDAEISFDGAGIFPSMDMTPVHIKGRGNTSWSSDIWDKNPYRLKFDSKVSPFGLKKGKNWVLLSNKKEGSMLTNAIGMKLASLVGTAGANHIIPIDLYINGVYRGHYNFTEKVGLSSNSIDLDDDSNAVLLELDTYYDEEFKFRSSPYNLPVNIKEPDFSENETDLTMDDISENFNKVMSLLNAGVDVSDLIDVKYLARYLMVMEMLENYEFLHPKSTFLYKQNLKDDSKYVFGPVWDLDYAFGKGGFYGTYYVDGVQDDYFEIAKVKGSPVVRDLRYNSPIIDKSYFKVWKTFMKQKLNELLDFCSEYYSFTRRSLEKDNNLWQHDFDYGKATVKVREWLQLRANYIFENLTNYDDVDYDVTEDGIVDEKDIEEVRKVIFGESDSDGDVNDDGKVNVVDVVEIANNIPGRENQAPATGNAGVNIIIRNAKSTPITISPLFKFVLAAGETNKGSLFAGSSMTIESGKSLTFTNIEIPNSEQFLGQHFANTSELIGNKSNVVIYDIQYISTTYVPDMIDASMTFTNGGSYNVVIR